MAIYFILLAVVFLLLFLSSRYPWLRALVFFILALFAGLRYKVGIDYDSYVEVFGYLVDGYRNVVREPLFYFVVKFLDMIGGTYQFMFLVFAGFTQYFMYKAIKTNSINFTLSAVLYFTIVSFYLFTFNVVRQWLALPVFLYSLKFLVEKDGKRFLLYNLVTALFFHVSLIFLIPLYFVIDKKFARWKKLAFIGGAIFVGISIRTILAYTPYGVYLQATSVGAESSIDLKIYVFLLFAIFLEIFRKHFESSRMRTILMNFNFVSILLLIILLFQNTGVLILVIKRMHNYFLATYIFLIPLLFNKVEDKFRNYFLTVTYMVLAGLYIMTVYFTGDNIQIVPYRINLDLFK